MRGGYRETGMDIEGVIERTEERWNDVARGSERERDIEKERERDRE